MILGSRIAMTHKSHWFLAVSLFLVWTKPSLAIDESQKDEVRQLVKEGGVHFDHGSFEASRDKFMAALALARVPAIAFHAGRAHEALGELVKAAQLYLAASVMQPNELWANRETQELARTDASDALHALLPRVQAVRIELIGGTANDTEVTVDGVEVDAGALGIEQPLEPGEHVVRANRGERSLELQVKLGPREQKTVTLNLERPAEPAPLGIAPKSAPLVTNTTPPKPETKPTAMRCGWALGLVRRGWRWARPPGS